MFCVLSLYMYCLNTYLFCYSFTENSDDEASDNESNETQLKPVKACDNPKTSLLVGVGYAYNGLFYSCLFVVVDSKQEVHAVFSQNNGKTSTKIFSWKTEGPP